MAQGVGVAIKRTGLVTSVGLSAPSACAAIRAKIANPTKTGFLNASGHWILGHVVTLERPWRGIRKLSHMLVMAVQECLADVPREQWPAIPLLLCVAEPDRPGRLEGLDTGLFNELEELLSVKFSPQSRIIAQGRVGAVVALATARRLLLDRSIPYVLVGMSDSLLEAPTLDFYDRNERLLTSRNSNGFIPGEGAGAVLVGRPSNQPELRCLGIGFGFEKAHIDSDIPLRGDGLAAALGEAAADAGCELNQLDFRISDVSGEQYYFKEAALGLSRRLRHGRGMIDMWHPAECTGEAGALVGAAMVALADSSVRKGFAPGKNILAHMSNDSGRRAAVILSFREA